VTDTPQLPYAVSLLPATSLTNHTGAWRTQRPAYVDLVPPCSAACPAGEDVRTWLRHTEDRDDETAWRVLTSTNPLPAVMGRICYRPCQTACNRAELDEAVGINSVERYLGDTAIAAGWELAPAGPPTGRHVVVVGSGPAGLAAAHHLRRLGHAVTVRESQPLPGGMLRYGIPRYRLPREVLDAEIQRLVATGIKLECGAPVEDLGALRCEPGVDAVVLAVGAQLGRRTYLPAGDGATVLDAVHLLHEMEDADAPRLGRRVVVYGGGNTAVDAARTARRLGATETLILYRRTRDRMPAEVSEVAEAEEEGVHLRWLSTISAVEPGTVTVERMELDDSGFPQPTGELEQLDADCVVLALGQESDLALLESVPSVQVNDGLVVADESGATGEPDVFACGDAVGGARTATAAVGAGRRSALAADAWLRSVDAPAEPGRVPDATYGRLTTWYYSDAPHAVRPRLEAARRTTGFEEVVAGLNEETARYEAQRCMSCGTCFECDNCYSYCPDDAIVKLGPGLGYAVDLDYCKGCGICAVECPAGAIEMVTEPD
jgi:2-oxoacid:acceptor oxidoreductase delta subunit (pyruvate/2-ketoisovalerate family)